MRLSEKSSKQPCPNRPELPPKPPLKKPPRAAMTVIFSIIVFIILFITMFVVGLIFILLLHSGILNRFSNGPLGFIFVIIGFAIVSVLIGTIIAAFISNIPLRPVHKVIDGMNHLAAGEYDTRLNLGSHKIALELSDSFNTLADELKNTEMLRSDFINNFSHEFKTPIVSVRGFAKLLQKGNLSPEKQKEYLDIIVTESSRLADMATNVLDLTKIENQSILTNVTRFNLSEQIRSCVLLLEKKWTKKDLEIAIDFNEYDIYANEELLKQVWINLLDNAIKFSPEHSEIGIAIKDCTHTLTVSIQNSGPEISAEDQKRIFNKFYQGDTSHAGEGTGIGLAIVKNVVALHEGSVSIISTDRKTTFITELPKKFSNL